MMNKSLLAHSAKSSRKQIYGFQQVADPEKKMREKHTAKKEPPFPAAFEVDNRRRQTELDRSTRCPKQGRPQS